MPLIFYDQANGKSTESKIEMNSYQNNQILHKALQSIDRLKRARLDDLEKIAEIEQTLASVLNNKSNRTCESCEKYPTCTQTCESVENKLSEEHKGSQNLERTYGNLIDEISDSSTKDTDDNDEILRTYDINYLKAIDRVRADDIFILYKNSIHLFSKKEWRVITLKLDEGLTYKTIGQILGISTSTASDTFQRAKRRMERHYQKKGCT